VPSLEARFFTIEGETQAVRVARRMREHIGGSPVRIAETKNFCITLQARDGLRSRAAVEEAATQLLVSLG